MFEAPKPLSPEDVIKRRLNRHATRRQVLDKLLGVSAVLGGLGLIGKKILDNRAQSVDNSSKLESTPKPIDPIAEKDDKPAVPGDDK